MPSNNVLTREELLFLKRAEGLAIFFDKISAAKTLIAEARVMMTHIAKHGIGVGSITKAKPKPTAPLSYGVDLPPTLAPNEQVVLAELKKSPLKPREIAGATKLAPAAVGRATRALADRKLITRTGNSTNLTWKAK